MSAVRPEATAAGIVKRVDAAQDAAGAIVNQFGLRLAHEGAKARLTYWTWRSALKTHIITGAWS